MDPTPDRDRAVPSSAPDGPRLTVADLACRRGERILFSGFTLDLAPGELVWLRAANGYGKTSLLRVLAGLARAESGSIHRTGAAPLYLAHANALKDDLTVTESIRFQSLLHGLAPGDAAMADAIRRLGLHARRHAPIRTLSQGQRRRVALTRLCLSHAPITWLLDEPWDALDAEGIAVVSTLLAEHAARGGNALFTSHVVPAIADASLRTMQLDAPA